MKNAYDLYKAIRKEEFDYNTLTSALSRYSGIRQKISGLLKSKAIIRVKKGIYIFGPTLSRAAYSKETLANQIYGPSYISLEYALAFYGFIPERVEVVTSVTPKRDKIFKTPIGTFSYRRLNESKYKLDFTQVYLDDTHPILIATPEKALCDLLVLKQGLKIKNVQELKSYLQEDLRIDLSKLKGLRSVKIRDLSKQLQSTHITILAELIEDITRKRR